MFGVFFALALSIFAGFAAGSRLSVMGLVLTTKVLAFVLVAIYQTGVVTQISFPFFAGTVFFCYNLGLILGFFSLVPAATGKLFNPVSLTD